LGQMSLGPVGAHLLSNGVQWSPPEAMSHMEWEM
jgi:hypothetical protein